MSAEDSLRELLGFGGPQLTFMGRDFDIRPDGLIPLLRYAKGNQFPEGHDRTDAEAENAALAASHRLLQDCVIDFAGLEALALEDKAGIADVTDAVTRLVSYYCARNHWPATRLMAYVALNLEQIDGQLIRASGRGLISLSAREACNLALAILLDGRDEEDRAIFLQDLNHEGNPDAEAMALVRQMQAARAEAVAQAAVEAARG